MMSSTSKIIYWADMTDIAFEAGGRTLPLEVIRRSGMRRMNLRIDAKRGRVCLTLPRFAPLGPAMRWVSEKKSWVEAQLAAMPGSEPIQPGMIIQCGDASYRLDWDETAPRTPRIEGGSLRVGGPHSALSPRVMRWLKRQALDRLSAETLLVGARAGVSIEKVGIGDTSSRWGSCSASGTIRYSWRLILAPDFVLKATVAHEVAHRIHMNHGAEFHALVAELLGVDPKPARVWLRKHGSGLHSFGRD
jgi:predicted metal-dependent hydrolase